MDAPTLCIKHNNTTVTEPCALCGATLRPLAGPIVFVEGTWESVCDTCSAAHAPALLAILRAAERGGIDSHPDTLAFAAEFGLSVEALLASRSGQLLDLVHWTRTERGIDG
jgi:hypothetical protein